MKQRDFIGRKQEEQALWEQKAWSSCQNQKSREESEESVRRGDKVRRCSLSLPPQPHLIADVWQQRWQGRTIILNTPIHLGIHCLEVCKCVCVRVSASLWAKQTEHQKEKTVIAIFSNSNQAGATETRTSCKPQTAFYSHLYRCGQLRELGQWNQQKTFVCLMQSWLVTHKPEGIVR